MKRRFLFSPQFHKAFSAISSEKALPAVHKVAIAKMRMAFGVEEKIVAEVRDGLLLHYADKDEANNPICQQTPNGIEYSVSMENRRKIDEELAPVLEEDFHVSTLPLAAVVDLPCMDAELLGSLMEAGVVKEN